MSTTAQRRIIPIAIAPTARHTRIQRSRLIARAGFFALFILAPVFDLLRYDLVTGHAWFLGMEWRIGLDDFIAGRIGALEAAGNVALRVFAPLLGTAAL